MKKIVSLALVLCMLCAFIPASFASAADEVTNLKVVYDFTKKIPYAQGNFNNYGQYTSGPELVSINYDTTNGFYKFGTSYDPAGATLSAGRNSAGQLFTGTDYYVGYHIGGKRWAAMIIRVPVAGTYTITQPATDNGTLDVYLSAVSEGAVRDDNHKLFTLSTSASGSATKTLTAGEYYISYVNPTASGLTNYANFKDLTLTIGEGTEYVTMGASLSFDKAGELKVGATKTAVVTYYDSIGQAANPSNVVATYASSDSGIASVDSATGLVTAVAPGVAEITATYTTVGGVSVSASAPIYVKPQHSARAGVSVKYDITSAFAGQYSDALALSAYGAYDSTHGFWKFYDNHLNRHTLYDIYETSPFYQQAGLAIRGDLTSVAKGANGVHFSDAWFALKINVPKDGVYTPWQDFGNKVFSQNVEVHLIPAGETDLTEQQLTNYVRSDSFKLILPVSSANAYYSDVALNAGEYYLVWSAATTTKTFNQVGNFYLAGGATYDDKTGDALMGGGLTLGTDRLVVGETETTTASASGYLSSTGAAATGFTYASSVPGVATVNASSGAVTAVSAGSTMIQALLNGNVVAEKELTVVSGPGVKLVYGANTIKGKAYSDHVDGPGYNLWWNNGTWKTYFSDITTYEKTGGFWKYSASDGTLDTTTYVDVNSMVLNFAKLNWIAIDLHVPQAGTYDVTVTAYDGYFDGKERSVDFYVLAGSKTKAQIASAISTATPVTATVPGTVDADNDFDATMKNVSLNAGTNVIVIKKRSPADYFLLRGISIQQGDGSLGTAMGTTTLDAETIEFGGTTAAGVSTNIYNSCTWDKVTPTTVTYASSNNGVATVSELGVVRGVSVGTAEITAIVDDVPVASKTVTVTPATASGDIKFAAEGLAAADVMYNNSEADEFVAGNVNNVPSGTVIKLTAPEKTGYKFAYWKLGGVNGRVVSTEETYTFTLVSPTYVIPVYDVDGTADKYAVELWNANGQIYKAFDVDANTTFGTAIDGIANPSLTGYTFTGWDIANDFAINAIVRAMAQYSGPNSVSLTVNGSSVEASYGAAVDVPDATTAGVWKLDGQVVRYADHDAGYTFDRYAWGGEEITFEAVPPTALIPVVAIADTIKGDAVMVEYDKGVLFTTEVGIIFGNSADITLDSYSSKASTQEMARHGQITAARSGSEGYARGYIVYLEGTTRKIAYTKAISF